MDAATIRSLRAIFGADCVFTDAGTLTEKSYDLCPWNLLKERSAAASVVVRPNGNRYMGQLQELMSLALESEPKLAVIPRGGGSGVCGAANAGGGEIIIDMSNLNDAQIVRMPGMEETGILGLQAGAMGGEIDAPLRGIRGKPTCGHYPASYYISTFGGWVGCGASGQYSAKFGKFGDMVKSIEGINGLGEPIALSGENLGNAIGLEGATMIVTGGFLPIAMIPNHNGYLSFEFDGAENVAEFLKILSAMRAPLEERGTSIYAARLYDYLDYNFISKPHKDESEKNRWCENVKYAAEKIICQGVKYANRLDGIGILDGRGKMSWTGVIYLASDSETGLLEAIRTIEDEILRRKGKICDPSIAKTWHKNRFKLGYDKLIARFKAGLMVDTFDCTPSWETLVATYKNVRSALLNFGIVGAHMGLDLDGPYIYFTFAWPGRSENRYEESWEAAISSCVKSGARTTHHHGIGKLKSGKLNGWAKHARGEKWLMNAAEAKKTLDPWNILNPNNFLKYSGI